MENIAARVLLKVPDCSVQVSVLFERVTVVSYISSVSIFSPGPLEGRELGRQTTKPL